MIYKRHDFCWEAQQGTDVLHKYVNLEGYSWLILLSMIVSIVLVITVDSAKESLQISADII